MEPSDPTFECEHCEDEVEGEKEYCDSCQAGPFCPKCRELCEWTHTPEGQKDRADDQKLSEWKERNLI